MNKSVGGLNAQSFALENISGNIANSQTTAFKRTDTSFYDLVAGGSSKVGLMTAGNVRASARSTINIEGSIEAYSTDTFLAVKGNGFFVVKQKAGEVDGNSVFNPGSMYTRRGDFQVDREGYLVNQAGYYLAGLTIDPDTNNPVGDTPEVIQINDNPIRAEETTEIAYRLNLPKTPVTNNSRLNPDVADSELWATPVSPVTGADEADFIDNSISGGAVTAYDASGAPVNVQIRWAKIANADAAAVPPVEDTWQAFYLTNSEAADADPKWVQLDNGGVAQDFTFDEAGNMTAPAGTNIVISDLTVDGVNLGDITMRYGDDGITQFDDTGGKTTVRQLTQNGLPAGNFESVTISDGGRVVAQYSNGKTVDLYQIPLVEFKGQTGLSPLDGGAYAETKESGPPINNSSSTVVAGSLEASNVDIAEEFTKLIVTQQAFSANSRVITTADQMMSDVINIIR
jgi:flagellar hook protein FlgE